MRLDLYTTGYPEPLPSGQFHLLLELLPQTLREKIGRFRRWQDAHASLLGKLVLRTALRRSGHAADLNQLVYSDWQKPSLPAAPHFNISHSGHRVVCILSDAGAVGIDIEALAPFSFDDLHPQFTAGEWTAIRQAPSPLEAFYRFWTAKESIIKADGRGLGIPLGEIDLSAAIPVRPPEPPGRNEPKPPDQNHPESPAYSPAIFLEGRYWSVYPLPLFEGYACHYAIEKNPTAIEEQPAAIAEQTGSPSIALHELTAADLLGTV